MAGATPQMLGSALAAYPMAGAQPTTRTNTPMYGAPSPSTGYNATGSGMTTAGAPSAPQAPAPQPNPQGGMPWGPLWTPQGKQQFQNYWRQGMGQSLAQLPPGLQNGPLSQWFAHQGQTPGAPGAQPQGFQPPTFGQSQPSQLGGYPGSPYGARGLLGLGAMRV